MTHPDILHIEATGYPPNSGEEIICANCGDYFHAVHDDEYCEFCELITCGLCGDDFHKYDMHGMVCEDCLTDEAINTDISLMYLATLDKVGVSEEVAYNAIFHIYQGEKDAGIDVLRKYAFLVDEITELVKLRLDGEPWHTVNYMTLKWPLLLKGILIGLKETCLDDTDDFACWLINNNKEEKQ